MLKERRPPDEQRQNCNLSVMECGLVWEYIILSRKQASELSAYLTAARHKHVTQVVEERAVMVAAQTEALEAVIRRAHLPLPRAFSGFTRENLIFHDTLILAAIMRITQQRIHALSYIMRSMITNNPLRTLVGDWLGQEACVMALCVKTACQNEFCTSMPV